MALANIFSLIKRKCVLLIGYWIIIDYHPSQQYCTRCMLYLSLYLQEKEANEIDSVIEVVEYFLSIHISLP